MAFLLHADCTAPHRLFREQSLADHIHCHLEDATKRAQLHHDPADGRHKGLVHPGRRQDALTSEQGIVTDRARGLTGNSRQIPPRGLICHLCAAYQSVKARINVTGRTPTALVNRLCCRWMCAMAQSSSPRSSRSCELTSKKSGHTASRAKVRCLFDCTIRDSVVAFRGIKKQKSLAFGQAGSFTQTYMTRVALTATPCYV